MIPFLVKVVKFYSKTNFSYSFTTIKAPGFIDENNNSNSRKVTLTVLQKNECDESKTYPIPHNTYTKGKLIYI